MSNKRQYIKISYCACVCRLVLMFIRYWEPALIERDPSCIINKLVWYNQTHIQITTISWLERDLHRCSRSYVIEPSRFWVILLIKFIEKCFDSTKIALSFTEIYYFWLMLSWFFSSAAWNYEPLFWGEGWKATRSVKHSKTTGRNLVYWRNVRYIPLNQTDVNNHFVDYLITQCRQWCF